MILNTTTESLIEVEFRSSMGSSSMHSVISENLIYVCLSSGLTLDYSLVVRVIFSSSAVLFSVSQPLRTELSNSPVTILEISSFARF